MIKLSKSAFSRTYIRATTHTDLWMRARERHIPTETIHNASIMNAIGVCGLQLYRYGEAVSIALFTENWRPDSWYDKIKANLKLGLHTLCLLDIKVKEPSLEALARGKKVLESRSAGLFSTRTDLGSVSVKGVRKSEIHDHP
mmetsp:Transcript_19119/g.76630  ORF Transcript_19119/g.76630 Transcript_19119/m.76630 type:complete len:142 (+) Transcript_19119:563-988(+)